MRANAIRNRKTAKPITQIAIGALLRLQIGARCFDDGFDRAGAMLDGVGATIIWAEPVKRETSKLFAGSELTGLVENSIGTSARPTFAADRTNDCDGVPAQFGSIRHSGKTRHSTGITRTDANDTNQMRCLREAGADGIMAHNAHAASRMAVALITTSAANQSVAIFMGSLMKDRCAESLNACRFAPARSARQVASFPLQTIAI